MAGSKGDVELVIRAKNEATRNLDAVNKSLKALADQQTLAGNSAGSAQGKFAQLGAQLQQLKTNAANLKSLSAVATVLDGANAAMLRIRAGAADAGTALESLTQKQGDLAGKGAAAAAAAVQTAAAVKVQSDALNAAQKAVTELAREQNALATAETRTQTSIAKSADTIQKLNVRLQESVAKQAAASAAVNGSESATKRQTASLEAAERAMGKRQAALDKAVAKEVALRAALTETQEAMARNKAAFDTANAALAAQAKVVTDARAANAAAQATLTQLGAAERAVATDIGKATAEQQKQVAALKEAEAEYAKLKAAADAARAAVGANAPALNTVGAAAGAAAIQVATLVARMAGLNSGGARTSALGIDPTAITDANGKVRELGVTIRLATNEATKSSVSMQDLKTAVIGLGATKNQIGGLSEALTRQNSAIDSAKAEWMSAQAEVKRLAIALKATAEPSEALAAGLGRAQAAARNAKDAFTQEQAALTAMVGSLQQAGVGAGTLASAEAALGSRINELNGLIAKGNNALGQMAGSVNNAGNSASTAAPKVGNLRVAMTGLLGAVDGLAKRTNPLGGLTGSITGAIGAAAGLYGIKDQLDKILDAGLALEGNKQRFASAFGGFEQGSKELAYARQVAENLKLPINDLAKGYSRLALAAKNTSLEGEGARKIFEAFAQSSRVNQTSTADLEGVFTALTQIMSKGTVQAEELRQQLGDRLPGALQALADGLGITVKDLDKLMTAGKLSRDVLLNMAQQVSNNVAPVLADALKSPAAQIQYFENQVTKLRETIAGSGFLNAFADSLAKVGAALSTPEAIQGAQDLGKALGDLVLYLAQAPEHFEEIVGWIKAFGAAWVGLQIASIATGLYGFATAIGVTAIAALGLDVALAPILVGLAALAAVVATVVGAFAAWKLAEWCYENFPAFAEGVQGVKLAALDAWDGIITAWEVAAATLKGSFTRVMNLIKNTWYGTLNDIVNFSPAISAKLGLGEFAEGIAKQAADAAKDTADSYSNLDAEIAEINKRGLERQQQNAKNTQDAIYEYHRKRITDAQTDEEKAAAATLAAQLKAGIGGPNNVLKFPGAPDAAPVGTARVTGAPKFTPDTSKEDAAAAKKAAAARLSLEKSVANEMFGIRAQLEKKSADTLQESIDAVPAKYAALYGKLKALGKGKEDQDVKDLDALVAQEQQQLRINDVAKRAAAERKAEAAQRKATADEEKAAMDAVITAQQTRTQLQEEYNRAAEEGDNDAMDQLRESLQGANEDYKVAIESALGFWATSDSPDADKNIAKLELMRSRITNVKDAAVLTTGTVSKAFGSNLLAGANTFVDTLASTGNVFTSLKAGFADFARSFLINIAKMIVQALLLRALGGVFGTTAGTVGGYIQQGLGGTATPVNHAGGVVGGTTNRTRTGLTAADFTNAIKYHGGGQAGKTGIANDEVATVLQKGETIRTEAQEAALARNQGSGDGSGQTPVNLKIVNAIDSASVLNEGLSSKIGQQTFMNFLRANKGKIQGILN